MDTTDLYCLPRQVKTRWASAENYAAQPGAAAQANYGRKGSPSRPLAAGESFVMAQAAGMGTVRRLWITVDDRSPEMLRGLVLRMYWDDAGKPAVEVPLADFFCQALGRTVRFRECLVRQSRRALLQLPHPHAFPQRVPHHRDQ